MKTALWICLLSALAPLLFCIWVLAYPAAAHDALRPLMPAHCVTCDYRPR